MATDGVLLAQRDWHRMADRPTEDDLEEFAAVVEANVERMCEVCCVLLQRSPDLCAAAVESEWLASSRGKGRGAAMRRGGGQQAGGVVPPLVLPAFETLLDQVSALQETLRA